MIGRVVLDVAGGYPLVYADPPWPYRDKAKARVGAERHYESMPHHVILAHLDHFAAGSCALACWMTEPDLFAQGTALAVGGWRYRSRLFSWVKVDADGNPRKLGGMVGTRSNVEACYLWTRGNAWPRRVDKGVSQVIVAPLGEHSEKPDEARRRIELLFGNIPRIELYSRKRIPGWDVWGNEVGKLDQDSSVQKRSGTNAAGSSRGRDAGARKAAYRKKKS